MVKSRPPSLSSGYHILRQHNGYDKHNDNIIAHFELLGIDIHRFSTTYSAYNINYVCDDWHFPSKGVKSLRKVSF